MGWRLKGRYVASCSCVNVCPCSTASAPPDNPDGSTKCHGVAIFEVREGNREDTDLSGVRFAFANYFPDIITSGNWTVGVTVDDGASEAQAEAIGQILSGQLGGPFGEMAALVSTVAPLERAPITFSDGGGSIGGRSFTYEPIRGGDGNPTTMSNAAFGFAPTFEIGSTVGKGMSVGHEFEGSYGESGDFEFTDMSREHIRA